MEPRTTTTTPPATKNYKLNDIYCDGPVSSGTRGGGGGVRLETSNSVQIAAVSPSLDQPVE